MNYDTFEKKYTASKLRLLFGFALRTLGLFLLIWTIKNFLDIFLSQYYAYYFISHLLEFPADLILSAMIVCLWIFPKLTTVWVGKKEIRICKGFKKTYTYSLLSQNFYFYKKEGNKKLHTEHLFLRVYDEEETEDTFRLYYFDKNTFTKLSSTLHAAETNALPVEVRSETAFHDLQEGQMELTIPYRQIIRSEWKLFFISNAILIIALIAAFLLHPYMNTFYQYFILLLGIGVLIYTPIRAFQLFRNQKKCPHKLYRHGTFLTFDETRFSVSRIETIRMTAPNAQSNSIYPKNRYIHISSQGKKYKYWLGSTGTLSRQDYTKICQWVEKAFIHEPDKVVYEQR